MNGTAGRVALVAIAGLAACQSVIGLEDPTFEEGGVGSGVSTASASSGGDPSSGPSGAGGAPSATSSDATTSGGAGGGSTTASSAGGGVGGGGGGGGGADACSECPDLPCAGGVCHLASDNVGAYDVLAQDNNGEPGSGEGYVFYTSWNSPGGGVLYTCNQLLGCETTSPDGEPISLRVPLVSDLTVPLGLAFGRNQNEVVFTTKVDPGGDLRTMRRCSGINSGACDAPNEELATGFMLPNGILVSDRRHVYFVDGGNIERVGLLPENPGREQFLAGGSETILAVTTRPQDDLVHFAAGCVADGCASTVYSCPKDDCFANITELFTLDPPRVVSLIADDSKLYAAHRFADGNGALSVVDLTDRQPLRPTIDDVALIQIAAMQIGPQHLYWTSYRGVYRAAREDLAGTELFGNDVLDGNVRTDAYFDYALSVNAAFAFWTEFGQPGAPNGELLRKRPF